MGKISEIFNFENIGAKIKNFAKWFCWITIAFICVAALIGFIVCIANSGTAALCWIPLLIGILAPFCVWVNCWTLYAFGEYVENIQAIKNQTTMLNNVDKNLQALAESVINASKKNAKREAEEQEKCMAEEQAKCEAENKEFVRPRYICKKCGKIREHLPCEHCGSM